MIHARRFYCLQIAGLLIVSANCSATLAEIQKYEEDSVTRWQIEDARSQGRDREKQLLSKIDDLKKRVWELNVQLNEASRAKHYAEEDLRNAERDLITVQLGQL